MTYESGLPQQVPLLGAGVELLGEPGGEGEEEGEVGEEEGEVEEGEEEGEVEEGEEVVEDSEDGDGDAGPAPVGLQQAVQEGVEVVEGEGGVHAPLLPPPLLPTYLPSLPHLHGPGQRLRILPGFRFFMRFLCVIFIVLALGFFFLFELELRYAEEENIS